MAQSGLIIWFCNTFRSAGTNRHGGGDGRALRRRVATHGGPESCVVVCERGGAKRDRGACGLAIEPRNVHSGVPTLSERRKATSAAALSRGAVRTPRGQRPQPHHCPDPRDARGPRAVLGLEPLHEPARPLPHPPPVGLHAGCRSPRVTPCLLYTSDA